MNFSTSFDKSARVGLLTLICLLHGALFFSWRATVIAPDRNSITYLTLWNVPPASPRPKFDSAKTSKAMQPSSNARHRINSAQLTAPRAPVPEHDVQSTAVITAPRPAPISEAPLDLERLRSLAQENDKLRIKSPLERLHENEHTIHTIESQVAEAARRSERKDCQTAYGGMGLLALGPLLYDTVTDHGCKWK